MSDTTIDPNAEVVSSSVVEKTVESDHPGAEHLGDPGKRALDAMKEERRLAREEAAKYKSDFDALKAQVDGKEAEYKTELAQRQTEQAALSKANERILKAELRAAATGRLADPEDALRFLDLSEFEVGNDGEVDRTKITAALTALTTSKPYLGTATVKRFEGSADQGTRPDSTLPQLTRGDLAGMSPEAVSKALADGQLATIMGTK